MSFAPTTSQTIAYLRTLPSIRERCNRVFDLAKDDKLQYFTYHPEKESDVTAYCVDIIRRDFGTQYETIPPHGRWRHLDAGRSRINPLVLKWRAANDPPNDIEIAKRLIDLFLVAVLLDAGAGNVWTYTESESGMKFSRSEGLAVAAYHMFEAGLFSGDASQPYRVDAVGLARLTPGDVDRGMQVDDENTLAGLEGRTQLLINLGTALRASPEFFGTDARPGNLVDFLEKESIPSSPSRKVPVAALWHALIIGLQPIWPPARTNLGGESLGDVWPCAALASDADTNVSSTFVPFHKLTGWLTYSLMEPLTSFLGWQFEGVEDMTGLPEYRNGGLLLDLGVLSLKSNPPIPLPRDEKSGRPKLDAGHPAIVEWRAMTVILLDRIHAALRLSLPAPDLTLAQALESATWKGGREIAKTLRGPEGGPPIDLISDGTVF